MSAPKLPRAPVPVLSQHFSEDAPPIQGAQSVFEPASLGKKDGSTASQLDPDADTEADDDPMLPANLSPQLLSPLDVPPPRRSGRRGPHVGPLSALGVPRPAQSLFEEASRDMRAQQIVDAELMNRNAVQEPRTLSDNAIEELDLYAPFTVPVIVRSHLPPTPPAPTRAEPKVRILSMGPASADEEPWVVKGNSVLGIATKDKEGRNHVVMVYLAVIVRSYSTDDIALDLRWHGVPSELDAVVLQKLSKTRGGERKAQIEAMLRFIFSYTEPRLGMVVHVRASPTTDADTAGRAGFQWWDPSEGPAAVAVTVDMTPVERAMQEVMLASCRLDASWGIGIRKWLWSTWLWRRFWPEMEQKYLLGQRYEREGIPPQQTLDGLTGNQRRVVLAYSAYLVRLAANSVANIAWSNERVTLPTLKRGAEAGRPTSFTCYEPEGR